MNVPVGVILVGHGGTASGLLAAARDIVSGDVLDDVVAVDAGEGETPELAPRLCDAIDEIDRGRGVVLLVDLLGASPCRCAERQGEGRDVVLLSGLNLAMLLKLAGLDRTRLDPEGVAQACADSARRAVEVRPAAPNSKDVKP